MQLLEGQLVYSASDLVGAIDCEHLTTLELMAARGQLPRPSDKDASAEVVQKRGFEHERRQLAAIKAEGVQIVELAPKGIWTSESLRQAENATMEAMKAGAQAIYQATFFDGRFRGHADLLLRVEHPSPRLGAYSYEVLDMKLARTTKAGTLLQLCAYSEQLGRLQGSIPLHMHVVGGTGSRETHAVADFSAYFRVAQAGFLGLLDGMGAETYPEPVEHCSVCRWSARCAEQREADQHLSLVAGMRRDQVKKLTAAGVNTVAALGSASVPERVRGIGESTLTRLRGQARMQLNQRADGKVRYELLSPVEEGRGLCLLPEPSDGDLFFDMEGDPYVEGGIEYLFGFVQLEQGAPAFRALWAHHRAAEKAVFEAFIDTVMERRRLYPAMHVYHYAPYEPSAMKRLMGLHGTREEEVDTLLRGRVFVDLYQVVRQALRVSQPSYSIKALEPPYREKRQGDVKDAASSIVAYEAWLDSGDPQQLMDIEQYNREDCVSTFELRNWLEARRTEAEASYGSPLPRRAVETGHATEAAEQKRRATQDVMEALLRGLPATKEAWTPEQRGVWLLAQLLDFHRREGKPEWWAYFERLSMTDEELFEDSESLVGLTLKFREPYLRSDKVCLQFDPKQEHKILTGHEPCDPRTGKRAGEVLRVDNQKGELELKISRKAEPPTALVPAQPRPSSILSGAILKVGEWVVQNGMKGPGPSQAVRALLCREPPSVRGIPRGAQLLAPGADVVEDCCRLALSLEDSYLAVQGPPGSGKTFTGARMVLALLAQGRRVGITAHSHRAIANLLSGICSAGEEKGERVRILQRVNRDEHGCPHPFVETSEDNDDFVNRMGEFSILAGTAWLFAREDLSGAVDTLFIDEAGQMSLANVVAMGSAARNVILLGDPQQLAQPLKGQHPEGAGGSALEHILDGRPTMPEALGVFLGTSWRMHPDVCQFISDVAYEGLLKPHDSCRNQILGGDDVLLSGAGLRYVPVQHEGNRSHSHEEIDAVAQLWKSLLGLPWTDAKGAARPLSEEDLLLVSPYNAQVARLKERLPQARVGTVDRFQGQEAPVTVYSLATSSAEDVPRTLEFLFELNRLNVAVSRAKTLSVVVCSPLLLRARCRAPDQMRLVNALCRFVEGARNSIGGVSPSVTQAGGTP